MTYNIKSIMPLDFVEILNYTFWNNSFKNYLIALGVFVLSIIVLRLFKYVIVKRLKSLMDHTRTKFDDLIINVIDSIGWPLYLLLALYFSCRFIWLPELLEKVIYCLFLISVVYYLVKGFQRIINYLFERLIKREEENQGKEFDPSVIHLLNKIAKIVLWLVAVIIILQNLGYNISTLVAGLGIGGIAIAFAIQNILGDIFSSFSIYLDKPFQVGDFIIVGDDTGVVKKIGIKSTRIQTLQGEELVVSNKELTETRVHNYKKMEKRRIVFAFGVLYETPTEKLKKIPILIKDIIDKVELAEIDRVHFKSFGDFSLNFEAVYYLNSSDYNQYMDTQQEINLAIKEQFEKEGIVFAYPTQTIFVNKEKDIRNLFNGTPKQNEK